VKIGSDLMVLGIIYSWFISAFLDWCVTGHLCSATVSQLCYEAFEHANDYVK
jgi:hypothetical protein